MKEAVLCFGSNLDTSDARYIIDKAQNLLRQRGCEIKKESGVYDTIGGYANEVVKISTPLRYASLLALTKVIERELGRTPEMKETGIVAIDIDIVIFRGKIKRPEDYKAQYFAIGYSQI